MAGVLLHLAMGEPEKLDPENSAFQLSYRRAYAIGVLLPDIAKQRLIGSPEAFDGFFEGCSKFDILSYDEYLRFSMTHHFSPDERDPSEQDTKAPNLREFVCADFVDLQKPLWQGVLCHLMGDKAFYYKTYCVDHIRAMADFEAEVGSITQWDREKWVNSETGKTFYEDYDLLNGRIENKFGVLKKLAALLPATVVKIVLDSFSVGFSAKQREPAYMDISAIERLISYIRSAGQEACDGRLDEALHLFDAESLDTFYLQ